MSGCFTVLAKSVVVMVTREETVTRQQCLCPEPADAVLTAGEQNIADCTSIRRKEERKERNSHEMTLMSAGEY